MMHAEPRFMADASLSGLTKWLRLLGYDAIVFQGAGDTVMMRQAAESGRILLTRRRDMTERQYSGTILLLNETAKLKQLAFVVSALSLNIHSKKFFTRCLSCNENLLPVNRENVRDAVPAYVYEHCSYYNQCPKCRKIYWPGTHGRNAITYLQNQGIL